MASFEDLSLGPEVVEALAAEGFETASSFQEEAIPVVGRGNNLVARAGPGGGVLLAYGAPLVDRLDPDAEPPQAVVLAPTRARADEQARRLARLAAVLGRSVAALGGTWAAAERADVLFGTPQDFLAAVKTSTVKLESVNAFVVDGAAQMQDLGAFEAVETLAGFIPAEAQKILVSLPFPEALETFVERHLKRPVRVPSTSRVESDEKAEAPRRGSLRYRVVDGDREEATLGIVGALLDDGARHVLIHFRSDDEAADVGDALTLHGYGAGAPGTESLPIWLGTDSLESRKVLDELEDPESVATLSYRVPEDPDSLDLRHGRGGPGITLLRGRELPHLEDSARVAGYELRPLAEAAPRDLAEEITVFRTRIEQALEGADLATNLLLLEPLLEREGAARVAAAVAALLRGGTGDATASRGPVGAGAPASSGPAAPAAWVRLFLSLGNRDGAGPGDILGAVTGEAEIEGSKVGRIDIRDTFSIVEVDHAVAERIIEAMNGTTVKGRSLRVDYARARGGGRGGERPSGGGRGASR